MPDRPDIPLEEVAAPERERFGQFVAVAIVATTLLAALCGYLQAHALARNGDALARGQQWSAYASRISDQDQEAQQLLTARAHRVYAELQQAAYDAGQARWNGQSSATASADQLLALARQTETDSRQVCEGLRREFGGIRSADSAWLSEPVDTGVTGLSCASAAALATRPEASAQLVAQDQHTLYELDGLRAASNTEAAEAEKQFTRYAVSLAILAVAVFLLGYSLTPHGRHHRKLYALTAVVFVLGATLWGIYAAVRSPETVSRKAMSTYADGRLAFDRGDYGTAVHDFTRVIAQQPNFASGYEWRANAYAGPFENFFQASPQTLDHVIADTTEARNLGSGDPRVINDLSASLYVSGMLHRDLGEIAQAGSLMDNAYRLSPTDPVIAINHAEYQLALRRPWRSAYAAAEHAEAKANDTTILLADMGVLTNDWDTPVGRTLRPSLLAAKQDLVASLPQGQGPAMSYAPPTGMFAPGNRPSLSVSVHSRDGSVSLSPGQTEFFIDGGRGFDPTREGLYAVWYQRSGRSWQTMLGVSGPVRLQTSNSPPDQNRLFAVATRSATDKCLTSGDYKVEVYANGRFAGQASASYAPPPLSSATLPDMGFFSICKPRDWQPVPGAQQGLIDGYVSPQRDAGVLVVDASAAAPQLTTSAAVLHRVLPRLGHGVPAHVTHTAPANTEFAGGMCNQYVEEDQYPGGILGAGIGKDVFGREIAGVVWGPRSAFSTTNYLFEAMAAAFHTSRC